MVTAGVRKVLAELLQDLVVVFDRDDMLLTVQAYEADLRGALEERDLEDGLETD